jgi:hypothetical protein
MSKSNVKGGNDLGVNQPQIENQIETSEFGVMDFDNSIKAARSGQKLSESVQRIFSKMEKALEYAKSKEGRSQILLPHAEYPLVKAGRLSSNKDVNNAKLAFKRRFPEVNLELINDAIAGGKKLNAIVVRLEVPVETQVETENSEA